MINQQVGDYRITNYLARGMTSEIYLVTRLDKPNSRLTVKVIRRDKVDHDLFRSALQKVFERLRFLDHPYVLKYHDLIFTEDAGFLFLEYVNGHSLAELVRPKGIRPVIHALGLFKQTLEAVAYAHSRGVVHGGFAANKAIYAIEKKLKLGDFGLRQTLWQLGAAYSKKSPYLAPELRDSGVVPTEQSDVYSLGVFLVHLLTGQAPEVADVGSMASHLRALRPDLPKRILNLVAEATHPNPAERCQSVTSLLRLTSDEAVGVKGGEMAASRTLPVLKTGAQGVATIPSSLSIEPEMVSIPAGPFLMGSNRKLNERPVQQIELTAFEISRYLITNRLYRVFCERTGRPHPPDPEGWTHYFTYCPDHPVINVSWYDAHAYCEWLAKATGKACRLPTEAEWEKAARGGLQEKDYPWGDEEPEGRAHFGWRAYAWELNRSGAQTLKVGCYPPNGYGLYDMAGNVWEWCENWYAPYGASSERKRRGIYKVARGGSWGADADSLRCAYRMSFSPSYRDYYLGFRIARQK